MTGLPSPPDRPAGAVEGEQDAVALGASALEAMMAAVLFRSAPAAQETDTTPAVPAGSAPQPGGIAPAGTVVSVLRQPEVRLGTAEAPASHPAGMASALPAASTVTYVNPQPAIPTGDTGARVDTMVRQAEGMLIQSEDGGMASLETPAVAPGATGEAMQVAAQAAQRLRSKTGGASTDNSDFSTSDVEALVTSPGSSDGAPASAATLPASPSETASTPLGLLEGMSDVGSVEALTPATASRMAVSAGDPDGPDSMEAGASPARAALVSDLPPMADTSGATSVAPAKANGLRSLPVAAQVAETVRAAVMRGDHEIRLLLNPGDLGRIDIRITEQNGVLQLQLDASRGSTRDLLAREMPALQQALESRDLRVERIQVSHSGSASADGSGAAWQRGSGRQGQQREGDGSPAWSPVASLTPPERGQQEARRASRVIRHHGALDRVA